MNKRLFFAGVSLLLLGALFTWLVSAPTRAGVSCNLPFNLQNNTVADATQVMANYNAITACLLNAAAAGANSDITALNGLLAPLPPNSGGTQLWTGGTSTGGNVIVISSLVPTSGFALVNNYQVVFTAAAENTGPTTLAAAGTAATSIYKNTVSGLSPLVGGEIMPNSPVSVIYNSGCACYVLLNDVSSVVPPGTLQIFAGWAAPTGWYLAVGNTVSRTSDAALFNALSVQETGATNGTTTISSTQFNLTGLGFEGGAIEGTNIPSNTTVVSMTATTVVMSNAATGSGAITLRLFPYGNGNGTTTFTLPDARGRVIFGRDNMGGGVGAGRLTASTTQGINGLQLVSTGGEQAHTPVLAEMFAHDHSPYASLVTDTHSHQVSTGATGGTGAVGASGSGGTLVNTSGTTGGSISVTTTATSKGSSTPFNVVPPGMVANVIIKR